MKPNDTSTDHSEPVLALRDLCVEYAGHTGPVRAVDRLSLSIRSRRTLALVGQSGCGKTTTALAVMGLLGRGGRVVAGRVDFQGMNLLELDERQLRRLRGGRLAMIFQEPAASLNPALAVGSQIAEALRLHTNIGRRAAWARAVELLETVGIEQPQRRAGDYPHQFSGGMCQRVMIAIAVCCRPALLIADEPTTALDVLAQAAVLDILDELQRDIAMGILLITHDLGLVAGRADEVAVMYASRIVEAGPARQLLGQPLHPYTRQLAASIPRPGLRARCLAGAAGPAGDYGAFAPGCAFCSRCPAGRSDRRCRTAAPRLRQVQPQRQVACWHAPGYERGRAYD